MAFDATQQAGRARPKHRIDLLTWPLLGPFLKWRHARAAMQIPILLLAGLMIFDGLFGPSLAPKNLATVGAWLHYRGLVVFALLVAGNLFCMACPFMLPRRGGRWLREHVWGGGRPVPRMLRNKWLAVVLIGIFFYIYERYNLWASPWWTAWVAVGYFLAAFVIDTCFQGAAFCKYVCPLGQFNFFGSLISPLEIKVREPDTCATCRTKDCIKGGPDLSGCELWLFQPLKTGNMDCTFCLDCIHACPYDNVGIIGRVPSQELWRDPYRSGIGRLSHRADLAALVVLLTFAGFVNAFSMIRPVYVLRERMMASLGLLSPTPVLLVTFIIGLIVLPAILVGAAGWLSRRLGKQPKRLKWLIGRYVYALVPLGFGMWLAHYSFHFLTGALTAVPVIQSFLADVGLYGGAVQWGLGPLVPGAWLFPIEAFFLYLGASGSVIAALQIAQDEISRDSQAPRTAKRPGVEAVARGRILGAALPWMALTLLLLAVGLWIMLQPMEMRGTLMLFSLPGG